MRALLLSVLVLAQGCGGKKDEPNAGAASAPSRKPLVADAAAPAGKPESKKPSARPASKARKLSKAERKQFNQHLRDGRALQKQKAWAEATATLELAIALRPSSDRALSELSWAAFKAGKLDRAAEAAEDASAFAIDPRVKAAALYNLGRVEEARKQPAAAIAAYRRSLRLRPNKIVKKQLLALGGEVPKLVSIPSCASFQPMKELCDCVRGAYDLVIAEEPNWPGRFGGRCEPVGAKRHGFQTIIVTLDDNKRARAYGKYFLARVKGDSRAVVANLGLSSESHKYNKETELDGVEEEAVGGKMIDRVGGERIYRVAITSTAATTEDYAAVSDGIVETTTDNKLLLCVDAEGFVKCPVQLLLAHSYSAIALEEAEGYEPGQAAVEFAETFRARFGQASPIERGFELDVVIDQMGTVTVTHKSGDKGPEVDRYLGSHQLW